MLHNVDCTSEGASSSLLLSVLALAREVGLRSRGLGGGRDGSAALEPLSFLPLPACRTKQSLMTYLCPFRRIIRADQKIRLQIASKCKTALLLVAACLLRRVHRQGRWRRRLRHLGGYPEASSAAAAHACAMRGAMPLLQT